MPPRLSARRVCLVFGFLVGLMVLASLHHRLPWPPSKILPVSLESQSNSNAQEDAGAEQKPLPSKDALQAAPQPTMKQIKDDIKEELDDNEVFLSDEETPETPKAKPWYFSGGTLYPKPSKLRPRLFSDEDDGDRIIEQLMYVPEDYQGFNSPEKLILVYNGLGAWGQSEGSGSFYGCPVSRCALTENKEAATLADAILYKDHFINPRVMRPINQVWILYFLECPYHTQTFKFFEDVFNWTATYRRDSDVVAPYERWTYFDDQVRQKVQMRDYAANKTKKVAWFVSNCGARNGRLAYARELAKHIPVDIYGSCGPRKCPRNDKKCFEILDKEYKFYLAFENSNCRDYITEKFYVNGLSQNVLPIVMGGRPEDYQRSAPEGSYIHVDEFANPAELAAYLHRLDKDNTLYNSYFKWKGTGEFINTYFWCRLCAMLHAPVQHRHYPDINNWWRGPGICTSKSWRTSDIV